MAWTLKSLTVSNIGNQKSKGLLKKVVPRKGLEPSRPKRALAPEASVSTNSTTSA